MSTERDVKPQQQPQEAHTAQAEALKGQWQVEGRPHIPRQAETPAWHGLFPSTAPCPTPLQTSHPALFSKSSSAAECGTGSGQRGFAGLVAL